MKKTILFTLLTVLFQSASAQNTEKYIEVGIAEKVELNLLSLSCRLWVESPEQQREYLYDEEYYYEMQGLDYGGDYESEMEEMSPSERKKLEKIRDERDERRMELNEEMARKLDEFEPLTATKLASELKNLGLSYTVEGIHRVESGDMEDDRPLEDTLIIAVCNSKEELEKLISLRNSVAFETLVFDLRWEPIEVHYDEFLPEMAERARKQAHSIALSMNKKCGEMLNCSNVYSGFSPTLFETESERRYSSRISGGELAGNYFMITKPSFIELIYRFAVE